MARNADAIEYFHNRSTPVSLAALALFDEADRKKAYKSLLSNQRSDGSWKDSLKETVRRIDLLTRLGFDIGDSHVAEAVEWVLWQQEGKNSYRKVFPSPTSRDMKEPFVLPTGEKLSSRASFSHIWGELSLRALLDAGAGNDPRVRDMISVFDDMVKYTRSGIY